MNVKHDKEKVLKKGFQLLCQEGYNAVGVDKICRTTGMTKGAFYNAFKSKENFLLSCLSIYSEGNTKRIFEKLSPKGNISAIDRLQRFYFGMLEQQPNINYMGCMVNNIMSELGSSNALVSEATNMHFESFLDAIEPTVIEAQKEEDITKDLDAKEITELLHSTFYGVLTRLKGLNNYKKGKSTMTLLFNSIKK